MAGIDTRPMNLHSPRCSHVGDPCRVWPGELHIAYDYAADLKKSFPKRRRRRRSSLDDEHYFFSLINFRLSRLKIICNSILGSNGYVYVAVSKTCRLERACRLCAVFC